MDKENLFKLIIVDRLIAGQLVINATYTFENLSTHKQVKVHCYGSNNQPEINVDDTITINQLHSLINDYQKQGDDK